MNRLNLESNAPRQRGAALLTVVLLLLLISVLVAAFVITVTGERAMSSNVHVAREALYAADAGVRLGEQQLANLGKTKLDSLVTIYSGTGSVIKKPSLIFPKGNLLNSSTNPTFSTAASITYVDSLFSLVSQIYNYEYTITSTGTQSSTGSRQVVSSGVLRLSAGRGSFADYLMFTNQHTMPDGSTIWFTSSGFFQGRVHTNGQFRFQGRPTFDDLVTSVAQKAYYYNNGSNVQLDDDHNKAIDAPNFYGGFKRGQANIPLPTNAYNQQNAAIGGDPLSTTSPSNSTVNSAIGASGSGTPANGIYVPNAAGAVTGGIYVQGNLDKCAMSVDGSGNQVYTMIQGAATVTITVNRTTNTTTVVKGGVPTVYLGTPRGVLYVNGNLNDLGGPARSGTTIPPAVADGNQLLVCASNDVVIQHDITYNDYYDGQSVLGVFSSGGSVRVGTSAPNDVQLNAFVMATGASGAFQVDNYSSGSPRGSVHLTGGFTAQYYGAFGQFNGSSGAITHGYARDFRFDDRGLIPPYFPSTSTFVANTPKAHTLVWKEQ